jgi:sortase (surface protein transpeptidase)
MENTVYIHTHKGAPKTGDIFVGQKPIQPVQKDSFSLKISELLTKTAKVSAIIGAILLFVSFAPLIWNTVKTQGVEFASGIFATSTANDINNLANSVGNIDYQPRFDASLPLENRIRIPSIGVDTEIQESTPEYYEEALKKGVWRVSDFGTPYTRNEPTIMAAHRFGYLAWTNIFRRENSFFSLPKLKEGDIVEIIWRQRKYVYEIYGTEESEKISDYSGDLILYTCETLSSPIRIYKYARLLEI